MSAPRISRSGAGFPLNRAVLAERRLEASFPHLVILRERLGILFLSLVYFEGCFGTLYE